MIILAHVVIALTSLAVSSYAAISPSPRLLSLSYASVILTLLSGSILVVTDHGALVQACTSGLLFSAASLGLATIARRKLAIRA